MNNQHNLAIYRLYAPIYDRFMRPLSARARRRAIDLACLQAGEHLVQKGSSRKYANLSMLFPEDIVWNIQQDSTPYNVARNIVDFISGLTDRHAISLFKKIKGFAA